MDYDLEMLKLPNELRDRFEAYDTWRRKRRRQYRGGQPIPELPPAELPKKAKAGISASDLSPLTRGQKIAVLRFYAEQNQAAGATGPRLKGIVVALVSDLGYSETVSESGLANLAKRVNGWSNEYLADYIGGEPLKRVRKGTISQELLPKLDAEVGDRSPLAKIECNWQHWLLEEIRFWVIEGRLPPRIASRFHPEVAAPPSSVHIEGRSAQEWQVMLRAWNDYRCTRTKRVSKAFIAELRLEFSHTFGEGLADWLKSLCGPCQEGVMHWNPGHVAEKKSVSTRTIKSILTRAGYKWIGYAHLPINTVPGFWHHSKRRGGKA